MTEQRTPYEILGQQGVRELADAFYDVMDELPQAARVRAMHADNLDDIKRKLAAYLTGWMGGPPVYLAAFGSVCLTDAHAPYAIDQQAREQWLFCMQQALQRVHAELESKGSGWGHSRCQPCHRFICQDLAGDNANSAYAMIPMI